MNFKATLLDQPRGLYILFFTEMWERFSFYGMRALLVLYLVNGLHYIRSDALVVYATYTALVYLTPIIGGYLADKWLGAKRAVLVGGIVMATGHFAMAFPNSLHLALGLLIVGNGFFKPNVSTLVGSLYNKDDVRRDSGFTIFYMGINLGAFLSPLVCGTLGELFGWHYGFAAAGVGMLFGLFVFIWGQKFLQPKKQAADDGSVGKGLFTANDWRTVLLTSFAAFGLVHVILYSWPIVGPWWEFLHPISQLIMGVFLISAPITIPRIWQFIDFKLKRDFLPDNSQDRELKKYINKKTSLTKVEVHRIIAIIIIGVFVVFFWMGFEQAGGTMNLFADTLTDRDIFGWEMPASYFQSINPLAILLLAPLFSVLWVRLEHSRFALSSVAKQAIGMIILGLGFVVLAVAQERADHYGMVGPIWLVTVYILHTMGELCLSPIGLSMVTKLAPAQLVSMLMGIWFTSFAIASYLAGTMEMMLQNSGIPLYWFLVGSSMGAGLLLLLVSPFIKRLMHGVH